MSQYEESSPFRWKKGELVYCVGVNIRIFFNLNIHYCQNSSYVFFLFTVVNETGSLCRNKSTSHFLQSAAVNKGKIGYKEY